MLRLLSLFVTAVGIAWSLGDPGIKFVERFMKSKQDSARALTEAMDYAAQYDKTASYVHKIALKPGAGYAGYYELKTSQGLYYLVVYSNGDLATKAAADSNWTQYKSPAELNKLYGFLARTYELNVRAPSATIQSQDFGSAVKALSGAPGAAKKAAAGLSEL